MRVTRMDELKMSASEKGRLRWLRQRMMNLKLPGRKKNGFYRWAKTFSILFMFFSFAVTEHVYCSFQTFATKPRVKIKDVWCLITDISATLIFVHHFNFWDIRTTGSVFGADLWKYNNVFKYRTTSLSNPTCHAGVTVNIWQRYQKCTKCQRTANKNNIMFCIKQWSRYVHVQKLSKV